MSQRAPQSRPQHTPANPWWCSWPAALAARLLHSVWGATSTQLSLCAHQVAAAWFRAPPLPFRGSSSRKLAMTTRNSMLSSVSHRLLSKLRSVMIWFWGLSQRKSCRKDRSLYRGPYCSRSFLLNTHHALYRTLSVQLAPIHFQAHLFSQFGPTCHLLSVRAFCQ